MFRIKICGITHIEDALEAAAAGADAIGLNFYAKSARYIEPDRAREIAATLPRGFCRVGVFVNSTACEVRQIAEQLALDAVQLHGDEPPELLAELTGLRVIRAFRVANDLSAVDNYLRRCQELHALPCIILLDAHSGSQYGGTGKSIDWTTIAGDAKQLHGLPLILAGGLTAENVAAAIWQVRPAAVDTASGVETTPGQKSPEKMRQFVAAAQAAFERIAATG